MARAGKLRELLGVPGFRALYASRLTSQTADGIFQASLVSYVLFSPERATSPGALAGALAIVVLPFSVIGPFAGIVLDRVSRQRVLVYCSLVRAALLAVLAVLIALGHTGADFYVVALAAVSVNRFVLAALSAGLPMVVDLERLVGADSLSVTSGTVAALVGGGIGTGLRGLTGGHDGSVALVAALAGLTYLGAAATAAGLADRRMFGPVQTTGWAGTAEQLRSVASDFADGARVLWRAGPARRALAALTASRAAYGLVLFMTILLYANYFKGDDGRLWGLAAVAVASGVGTVLAAVATPPVTARMPRARWILIVLVGGGIIEIVCGLPYSSVLFVVAGLPLGFSAQACKICVDTIVQEHVPDAYRGRAFSLYDLLFNVAFAGAGAVAALVVPKSGHSPGTIIAAGLAYLLAGVVYYLAARRHESDLRLHADAATRPQTPEPTPAAAPVAATTAPDVTFP